MEVRLYSMADMTPMAPRSMRSSRLRIDRSKLSVTDIHKLKNLPVTPYIEEAKANDYYIEPITIEYYIPKESRFAYEIKYLYIELYDPEPKNENQEKVMGYFRDRDEPIDVMEVMNVFPQFLMPIYDGYYMNMDMHEGASMEYKAGLSGENKTAIRRALYINEVLRKKEPTLVALEILGDYTTFNINWCVRFLNKNGIEHAVEDKTVEYLIKMHLMKHEDENLAIDDRFETLSAIYMDQAFPFDDEDDDDDD